MSKVKSIHIWAPQIEIFFGKGPKLKTKYFCFILYQFQTCSRVVFTPLRVGWPPTPQVYFGPSEGLSKGGVESPPWRLPKLGNFRFSSPWGLPKRGNFHFSPLEASQAKNFHFPPPVGAPQAREFSLFPPVGAPQAREFSLFPPVGASQAMEFSLFPPLEALQAAEFQIARQRRLDSPPNPVFFECVSMFLQWFPSKHGTFYTFVAIKPVENIMFDNASNSLISPTVENTAILQCFLQFFHVPMPVANSNIYKKSFQNIVFDSVFPMFPVKQTVIYTFFAIKAVNPSKTLLLTVFL